MTNEVDMQFGNLNIRWNIHADKHQASVWDLSSVNLPYYTAFSPGQFLVINKNSDLTKIWTGLFLLVSYGHFDGLTPTVDPSIVPA